MKKSRILFALIIIAVFSGCKPSVKITAPEWAGNPPPEGVLWGIGTAKQSSASLAMTTAEARAKVSIVSQINEKVRAMFAEYYNNMEDSGNDEDKTIQNNVTLEVSNMNLAQARTIQRWQAPDGTWWCLVEYRKADAVNAVNDILASAVPDVWEEDRVKPLFVMNRQTLEILNAQFERSETPLLNNSRDSAVIVESASEDAVMEEFLKKLAEMKAQQAFGTQEADSGE
jgi:hypothetical protein